MVDLTTGGLIVLGLVAAFVAGDRIPKWARNLGRAKGQYKLGVMDVQREVDEATKALRS